MSSTSPWENEANNWIRWVRTPGNDVFPYYAPLFFDEMVPAPTGLTLEIGCGEGRVTRELASRSHNVVGIDVSTTLVRAARDADAASAYLAGGATALPFADAAFDVVVAYNSLQTMANVEDMARAVREAARVVTPGGRFCICVAHPMTDIGLAQHNAENARSYFENACVDETVRRGNLTMTFHGWTYTVEDYARALEGAGFLIERMREPVPATSPGALRPDLERWQRVPLFLFLTAVKRPG